ncbi:chitinase [Catellatospora sp. TT07R-123]|uniref:carbohydrate-binding protein n=1 Tax=Catellatospora sp. TT07R-123 TaxID=2733863 RepID=UPI001B2798F7|nr:carbohydrate-binding protein [Catellatospora sp. TT07R-123]GHJ48928.1 chitinase [Catellatospora sp. TT07R-123]
MQRRTLAVLGSIGASLLAAATAAVVSAPAADAALTSNWYASAPYLMPFDNSPPDPIPVMAATGQKAFQLAFILAPNGGGCTPTWDGTRAVSADTEAANLISRIRANGGDVSVSIGGYGGTKLGQTCGTPAATAAAYQQVVTKYALKAIDFDLEEPEYENAAAVHNELGAAQILQRDNPGLYVSVTTAGTAAGTGWFGQQMLNDAKGLGFTPANYSIMPFDGGFNGGSSQISALEAFHSILMTTFGWSSDTAYAHEGVSMMNGRSDAGEYFRQADFQAVLDYATGHRLARYTYWSVNRDRQCADPNQSTTSGTCSSVPQTAWEFTKYTARFAGATPPTTPPSTPPSSSPTPPGGCSAPAWNSGTAYTGGSLVSYNGHTWKAQWWTQGETPGTAGVWLDQGTCTGTPSSPPPGGQCTAPAWVAATAYNGGAVVSYGGHKWTAKWWTQGDIPGNNGQGVWTDNGPC